jgi:hypothetical protein
LGNWVAVDRRARERGNGSALSEDERAELVHRVRHISCHRSRDPVSGDR